MFLFYKRQLHLELEWIDCIYNKKLQKFKCRTIPQKFNTQKNTKTPPTSTGTSASPRTSWKNYQKEGLWQNKNGEPWAFSNLEDGPTTKCTNQSLTSCFSEELEAQTRTQDCPQPTSSLLSMNTGDFVSFNCYKYLIFCFKNCFLIIDYS